MVKRVCTQHCRVVLRGWKKLWLQENAADARAKKQRGGGGGAKAGAGVGEGRGPMRTWRRLTETLRVFR